MRCEPAMRPVRRARPGCPASCCLGASINVSNATGLEGCTPALGARPGVYSIQSAPCKWACNCEGGPGPSHARVSISDIQSMCSRFAAGRPAGMWRLSAAWAAALWGILVLQRVRVGAVSTGTQLVLRRRRRHACTRRQRAGSECELWPARVMQRRKSPGAHGPA